MEDGTNSHTKKGLWTEEEDRVLLEYVNVHGRGRWNRIPKLTGLKRCGKSCRLRWLNYLSPNTKRGDFSEDEEDLIIRLHNLLGNRWSLIAGRVPGRTDNQVKNHWNTHLSKKLGLKQQARKSAKYSREHTIGNAGAEIHNTSNNNKFGLVENNKLVTTTEDPLVSVCSDTTSNENASEGVRAHPPQLYDHHDLFELDIPIGLEYRDGHYPLDQIWDRV